MQIDLTGLVKENEVIAVALSGGGDSMALLHYMSGVAKKYRVTIKAINVEHGIRGERSISDTEFVKERCREYGIELICYSVDSVKKAAEEKLSLEQAARILRYECFYDALNGGKCDKVATAHHAGDNAESVLFNLFRGTGLKGVAGITSNFSDKIIRPFITVKKSEIEEYVSLNSIPFVTDETNSVCDYTRNYLRHKIIPEIKKVFPALEESVGRLAEIARVDDDFIESEAAKATEFGERTAFIKIPLHKAVFSRAAINAMKSLGMQKDWEKIHVDSAYSLCKKENGSSVDLPANIVAAKEYDRIVFYLKTDPIPLVLPFKTGKINFGDILLNVIETDLSVDLKSGLYADLGKIGKNAVIRTRREGDVFVKFGGGSKKLSDYFTDAKVPLRLRDAIPVLADGKDVLAIFGIAVSDRVKVDKNTLKIVKFD